MDKKPQKGAANESAAVQSLRKHFDENQAEFAARLGVTQRTIARWEAGSPPPPANLSLLEREAAKAGRKDLQAIFGTGIATTLGSWDTAEAELDLYPRTDTEKLYVAAVLATLRNPQYQPQLVKLIPLLRKQADGCINILENHRLQKGILHDATRFLEAGLEPRAIAAALKVPEADVQRLALLLRMRRSLESVKEQSK